MAGVFGRLDARGPSFAEPFPEHAPPLIHRVPLFAQLLRLRERPAGLRSR